MEKLKITLDLVFLVAANGAWHVVKKISLLGSRASLIYWAKSCWKLSCCEFLHSTRVTFFFLAGFVSFRSNCGEGVIMITRTGEKVTVIIEWFKRFSTRVSGQITFIHEIFRITLVWVFFPSNIGGRVNRRRCRTGTFYRRRVHTAV